MRLAITFALAAWLMVMAVIPVAQADTGTVTVTIRCSEEYAKTHLEQCGPGPYALSGDVYEPSLERVG